MRQDPDRVQVVVECSTMGMDVDPVGQPTHHECVGKCCRQFGTKAFAVCLTVGGDAARAHHRHHMSRVEIRCAAIIQHGGSIRTLRQPMRIVSSAKCQWTYAVTMTKVEFIGRSAEGFFAVFGKEALQTRARRRRKFVERIKHSHSVIEKTLRLVDSTQKFYTLCLCESAQQREGDVSL